MYGIINKWQKKMKWESRNSSQNKSHLLISDKVKVSQSCPTLCNPTDCTVHGILQARILEWVAYSFSRGSSQPRNRTGVSCIAGGFFTNWAIREVPISDNLSLNHQLTCWALTSWQVMLHLLSKESNFLSLYVSVTNIIKQFFFLPLNSDWYLKLSILDQKLK